MSQAGSLGNGGGGGGGTVTEVLGGNNIVITGTPTIQPVVNVAGTTDHAVQVGNVSGSLTSLSLGTSGFVLTSQGAGVDPIFAALPAGGVVDIDGDTGTATPSSGTITFNGATNGGSTVRFNASGSTVDLSFTDGSLNTCIGVPGPSSLAGSSSSTSLGAFTLTALTTGGSNTAIGVAALRFAEAASSNVAIGEAALNSTINGLGNVVVGFQSFGSNDGNYNVGFGYQSCQNILTGSYNFMGGYQSGNAYTTSESSNILLQNSGVIGESNVMRLGTQGSGAGQVDTTFVAGIAGNTLAAAQTVVIDPATGQLGDAGVATNPGQSSVLVYLGATAGNVTGDNTNWTVTFDTEAYDQNNDFDVTTYTFTSPATGKYSLQVGVNAQGLSAGHDNQGLVVVSSNRSFYLGSGNPFVMSSAFSSYNVQCAMTVDMDAADTLSVVYGVGVAGTKTVAVTGDAVAVYTYLSINLVC